VQVTNIESSNLNLHVQIFDVSNNCNENNFFDVFTPNDTHIYNMRDILTNDGNPSGVVLPGGAYGFVSILPFGEANADIIGNMRILDENGYEYRTNAIGAGNTISAEEFVDGFNYTFNFNTEKGVTLSDVIGITVSDIFDNSEIQASNITDNFRLFDVDIVNNNETIFSCRDVVFACTDQNNPLLDELLATAGVNVASFEYGINEAIPHSKGGEPLCPGNTISEGTVVLTPELQVNNFGSNDAFFIFVGLNNGDGRGSFDSFWQTSICFFPLFDLCSPTVG